MVVAHLLNVALIFENTNIQASKCWSLEMSGNCNGINVGAGNVRPGFRGIQKPQCSSLFRKPQCLFFLTERLPQGLNISFCLFVCLFDEIKPE